MRTIGIVGGGQLGMMLAEAASHMREHISRVIVLDPTENCPATFAGAEQIVGAYDDADATRELASRSDIVTYEFEGGNTDALDLIMSENLAQVDPYPQTLRIIKDKLAQKEFLASHSIPVADYVEVQTRDDVDSAASRFGGNAILKARYGGYDGKGNLDIASCSDSALADFMSKPVMLEKKIDFEREISVIIARSTSGQTAAYPAVENMHDNGILRTTVAPARIDSELMSKADELAHRTLGALDGAGVFGIEMFLTQNHDILVNEIAPRVHNSGHHTLQSCTVSQFELHLRAVLGLDLGAVKIERPTVMYNILGADGMSGAYSAPDVSGPNIHLKMYNKSSTKPRRKLGHANIVGTPDQNVNDLLDTLESMRGALEIRRV